MTQINLQNNNNERIGVILLICPSSKAHEDKSHWNTSFTSTERIYLVARNDMSEIYECIVYEYDNRTRDIEDLERLACGMCHSMSK